VTYRLVLVGSLHHEGLLHHRIERAGLTIVSRDMVDP
jgi:hypothetical protein